MSKLLANVCMYIHRKIVDIFVVHVIATRSLSLSLSQALFSGLLVIIHFQVSSCVICFWLKLRPYCFYTILAQLFTGST